MKKNLLFFMLISVIFISGCNDKKRMECAYYEQNENSKIDYDYEILYDTSGKKIEKMVMLSKYTFFSQDMIVQIKENLTESDICKSFNSSSSANCEAEIGDDYMSVRIEHNANENEDDEILSLFSGYTYEELKSKYEENSADKNVCVFGNKNITNPVESKNGALSFVQNASESASQDNAYGILKAAEIFHAEYLMKNNGDSPGKLIFTCDGNECSTKLKGKKEVLDFKGIVPESGKILIDEHGIASISEALVINEYKCFTSKNEVSCSK